MGAGIPRGRPYEPEAEIESVPNKSLERNNEYDQMAVTPPGNWRSA